MSDTIIEKAGPTPTPPPPPKRVTREIEMKNLNPKQKKAIELIAAGGTGVALSAALLALMGFKSDQIDDPIHPINPDGKESSHVTIHGDAPFCEQDLDAMQFGEAFKIARQDVGPGGFFEWKGQYYNTYTKEEWDNMSPSQRNEYAHSLDDRVSVDNLAHVSEQEVLDIVNGEVELAETTDLVITESDDIYADTFDDVAYAEETDDIYADDIDDNPYNADDNVVDVDDLASDQDISYDNDNQQVWDNIATGDNFQLDS